MPGEPEEDGDFKEDTTPGNLSEQTVRELRNLAIRYHQAMTAKDSLFHAIANAKRQYDELYKEIETLNRAITDKLAAMDCASSSNYGWHMRITWMLAELVIECPPVCEPVAVSYKLDFES